MVCNALGSDPAMKVAVLNLYDVALNTRLTLGLREDGEPVLVLLDAHGKPVFFPYDPK